MDSLALKKIDYEIEVGDFLGYGRDQSAWRADNAAARTRRSQIDAIVKAGVHNFYFPALADGQVYEWSFLRPTVTLTLGSGESTLPLPRDFNGFVGPLVLEQSNRIWRPIPVMVAVRQRLAESPDQTGPPQVVEVEAVKGSRSGGELRMQLLVFPAADQSYTLRAQYSVVPDALSGDGDYVYGGIPHHQTVLESCLAVAEQRRDDEAGLHTGLFQQRLRASIMQDRRLKPKALGQNRDRSDELYGVRRPWRQWDTVTIDGVDPSI